MEYIVYTRAVEQLGMILFATAFVLIGLSTIGALWGTVLGYSLSVVAAVYIFKYHMGNLIPKASDDFVFTRRDELKLAGTLVKFSIPVIITAIAEMLIQSHEGYINLLPAISEEFKNGSFSGILARGNFTVDLTWANGAPTTLTVTSGSGSDLGIYYPAYSNLSITNSKGEAVDFTVEEGIIRLSTQKSETYTVTGFTPKAKAKMPQQLTATNTSGSVTLNWQASASTGATYNIYRAYESEKTYTFLGSTASLTFTDISSMVSGSPFS
jgi:hypothetical protein